MLCRAYCDIDNLVIEIQGRERSCKIDGFEFLQCAIRLTLNLQYIIEILRAAIDEQFSIFSEN